MNGTHKTLTIAYYCSGHGFGHATRVSAFAKHLRGLKNPPIVHIVSSAPTRAFEDSIAAGAQYRHADIDAVVSQPVAYRVDRKKSLAALRKFIDLREIKIEEESQWLIENHVDALLSDSAFLACAAAHRAGIPSALVTNFTFDSIWSYLACPIIDPTTIDPLPDSVHSELEPDVPIPHEELAPYVEQIVQDYRCADLLLRLPGCIPIPSFSNIPALPSTTWVNSATRAFNFDIIKHLRTPVDSLSLHPPIQFPVSCNRPPKSITRKAIQMPLLVRHPSSDIYTPEGRSRLLNSMSIPQNLHDPKQTRILIVSFGGQIIRRPNGSRSVSRPPSPEPSQGHAHRPSFPSYSPPQGLKQLDLSGFNGSSRANIRILSPVSHHMKTLSCPPRIATPSHIYIPGAPGPVSNPNSPINPNSPPSKLTASPDLEDATTSRLLPEGWIAIVCDVGDAWGAEDLPEGFYVAPKGVYMPDVTAVGDVLLGKLGYGTVSECVDACTPFVYVPRPLFIEEYGLRMLMQSEGVAVELSREEYEGGDWAQKVEVAWRRGRLRKEAKRAAGDDPKRKLDIDEMARSLVTWIEQWQGQ